MAVISNGVIGGALSYLLRTQGVSAARGAEIIALLNLPQTIYFLWSPVTDLRLRRRTWLMAASLAAGGMMLLAFMQPRLDSALAIALMFVSACLGQIVVAACGGMMGELQSEAARRRAGSFYQAGSLAFGAGAVFVLTALSARVTAVRLGWMAAVMIALPSLAAVAAPAQQSLSDLTLRETLRRIWTEFRRTFFRRRAIPYSLVMLAPMGSGAMIQLLPGLAPDYHLSGGQVAWINGLAGSLLTAAGAMAATLLPSRSRAPMAYVVAGIVNAATLLLLWLGPMTPTVYIATAVPYLFSIGASYALFTAVVLEFLGGSGKSGSGRYSIINSMGNVPVAYMVLLDGKGYARWGARGMVGSDLLLSTVGAAIFLVYLLLPATRRLMTPENLDRAVS